MKQGNDWMSRGLCVGASSDLWFGVPNVDPHANTALNKQAYAVCERCPVSRPCYEMAAAEGEKHGIWGGVPFGGKSNRVYVTRRLTRMQELWASRGEDTRPAGKFTDADRWFDPDRRDAVVLAFTKPARPDLTVEDRRREAAAEAAS